MGEHFPVMIQHDCRSKHAWVLGMGIIVAGCAVWGDRDAPLRIHPETERDADGETEFFRAPPLPPHRAAVVQRVQTDNPRAVT